MAIRLANPNDVQLLAKLNRYVHENHFAAEPRLYRPTQLSEVEAWFVEQMAGGSKR